MKEMAASIPRASFLDWEVQHLLGRLLLYVRIETCRRGSKGRHFRLALASMAQTINLAEGQEEVR